jgi:hypothetical protein
VKSSVLFLKKHAAAKTKRMRDTKQALKDSIRSKEKLEARLDDIARSKNAAIKELGQRPEFAELTKEALKENDACQDAAKAISDEYAAQVDELRFRLSEVYEERRRKGRFIAAIEAGKA